MLRIRRRQPTVSEATAEPFKNLGITFGLNEHGHGEVFETLDFVEFAVPDEFEIVPVFGGAMLELLRLLREAANIEHALAVQYLYAGYSVRKQYFGQLSGTPERANSSNFFGVAIGEMHHLATINLLLRELKSAPYFEREDFPFRSDIYPFELSLERLSLHSLAKYVVAESPKGELDPAGTDDPVEQAYRIAVAAALNGDAVNHIGSLYRTIKVRLTEAEADQPSLVADLGKWLELIDAIITEGEDGHYGFLKSVFLANHPAFAGQVDVWGDPYNAAYPSRPVPSNPTAFEGSPRTIAEPMLRQLAWLGDLQYWAVIGLLHVGSAFDQSDLTGQAVTHMIGGLHVLARHAMEKDGIMPFDAMSLNFQTGQTLDQGLAALRDLMREIIKVQADLQADLPTLYSRRLAGRTLTLLGG